jgi:hypothetical protein
MVIDMKVMKNRKRKPMGEVREETNMMNDTYMKI